MAYTAAQWAKIQASLPSEDRVSYDVYIASVSGQLQQLKTAEAAAATPAPVSVSAVESKTPTKAAPTTAADAQTAVRKLSSNQPLTDAEKKILGISVTTPTATKAEETLSAAVAEDDPRYYTVKVGTTGKTSAQLWAAKNATETASLITSSYSNIGITAAVDPTTGKVVMTNNSATKAAEDAAAKAAADAAAKAAIDAAVKAAKDKADAEAAVAAAKTAKELADAKAALIAANQAAADAAAAKAASDKTNAALQAEADAAKARANLNVAGNVVTPAQIAADVAAKAAADKIAADAQLKESNRQSIITILQDRFAKYGMTGLGNKIKELAIDGATEATITLGLQETDEYKTRFKANEERLKKGLTVLQPAEYLNLEDGYRQVLRSYGLKAFDNDEYVQQFIANDVSAAELSNRVVTAVQRVQNADPAVSKQLRDYYGIGSTDLVAYVLDPNQQMQKIERQVAAAEIGVAAGRQGLTVGSGVAEQLAAQGISQAEAQKGYSTIADILPTAEKLSAIYGSTTEKYGQSQAEQEVFNSLASAQRARQKLSALEVAQFSGSSGLSRNALTSSNTGNF